MSFSDADMTGSMLHTLDQSPTSTPLHTRAGSPNLAHSHERAMRTIKVVNGLVSDENTQLAKRRIEVVNGLVSNEDTQLATDALNPLISQEAELIPVHIIDGSANVTTASKIYHLSLYLAFNLGLTLFNKAVMIQFPFPFLLTALHAAAGVLGTIGLSYYGKFTPKSLGFKEEFTLYAFSVLYTFNIAISNASLAMVTVPFHQIIRAITPVFTVAIYRIFFSGIYSLGTYLSIVPVILGVGLTTYGDYYATSLGFFLTLLGAMLAAIKTVVTNRMQTAGVHFSAMELLYRLSPLAVVQSILMAYYYGELASFQQYATEPGHMGRREIFSLAVNAAMAFGLNFTSFTANKKAGALTMTVAANLKQILAVLLSIIFWHLRVHWTSACGIVITLLGGMWYGHVELMGRRYPRPFSAENIEEGKVDFDHRDVAANLKHG